MEIHDLMGALGVSLLLIAFLLSLFKIIDQENPLYLWLNLIGAGLACYASILIPFIPFVILEGTWALVALVGLIRLYSRKPQA